MTFTAVLYCSPIWLLGCCPKATQRSDLHTWLPFVLPIWPVPDLVKWIFHLCSICFSSLYFLAYSVMMLWSKPTKHAVSFVENAYFFYHETRFAACCFRRKVDENGRCLGSLATSNANFLPTFRYYLLVPSSRDSWPLEWDPIGCPETQSRPLLAVQQDTQCGLNE